MPVNRYFPNLESAVTYEAPTWRYKVAEAIRNVTQLLYKTDDEVKKLASADFITKKDAQRLYGPFAQRASLQVNGVAPLNIAGLIGGNGQVIVDTYANIPSPQGLLPGTLFWATDRTVMYMVEVISATNAWAYILGIMVNTLANRPTPTANDSGFRFVATDTAQHFRWTGTAWVEEYEITNAVTNLITDILNLIHRSSGTPAAAFGAGLLYQLDSSTNVLRDAGDLAIVWSTATNASEDADFIVRLMAAGATRAEKFRVTRAGNLRAVGKVTLYNNAAPTDGQLLIGDTAEGAFDAASLTAGTGITITPGAGAITIAATATSSALLPLFDHFVDAGNGTTVETDLYSDTIAASQLASNGDKLWADYSGIFVLSATATRQLRAYFGGTLIFDSGALSITGANASWDIEVSIIRVSSSVVRCSVTMNTSSAALVAYSVYTEVTGLTLANTQILKITGQAAGVGAATDDIVAKLGSVEYIRAA